MLGLLIVEAQQMGVAPLHLQAGTKGTLVPTGQRPEVVCWRVDCSAVKVFSFRTRSLLSSPGVGVGEWVWQWVWPTIYHTDPYRFITTSSGCHSDRHS